MSEDTATTATTPADLDQLWRRFSERPAGLHRPPGLAPRGRRRHPVDRVPANGQEPGQQPDGEPDPDEAAEKELASCLVPMLSGLPAEQAAAPIVATWPSTPSPTTPVKMVDLDARTHAAAAGEAGISVSGMKSRVQRGRAALQARLHACCQISQDRAGPRPRLPAPQRILRLRSHPVRGPVEPPTRSAPRAPVVRATTHRRRRGASHLRSHRTVAG